MGDAHLGHQLKRKEEVVKAMLFCKLQRPPLLPLYILLSGERARLQLLAEAVPGVKPASWGHKVTAGNPAQVWGRLGLNDFPDTHAELRGREGRGRPQAGCLLGGGVQPTVPMAHS